MLSEGDLMYAESVNYRTDLGTVMDYRTVEALVRLGVLAPACVQVYSAAHHAGCGWYFA